MKTYLSILLFAAAIALIFSGCKTCYPCLADGESFDLPYHSNQIITFKNDTQNELILTADLVTLSLPPDEYCGRIGSGSYYACGGDKNIVLRNNNDSLVIGVSCSTGFNHDVEVNVDRTVYVIGGYVTISKGVASTPVLNSTLREDESMTINGVKYSNVYEYNNSSAGINECTNFVYNLRYGVLKFSIKLENSVENWVLVQ
jgi:hypothetical protein